jgi:hypothetical protein
VRRRVGTTSGVLDGADSAAWLRSGVVLVIDGSALWFLARYGED